MDDAINGQILTDADLKALEPQAVKYVHLLRADAAAKHVKVSTQRIMAVHGGSAAEGAAPQFSLELSNRAGKASIVTYRGTTESLFAQFNELGVRKEFLAFEEVQSPLPNMRREAVQASAVRIALINAIRRPPGYRTSHGYKVKSVIERLDGQPMRAFEEVVALGQRITEQGFKAAPGSGITAFMLHPDQATLLNPQGQRLTPVKAPRRRQKMTQKSLI